MGAHRPGHAPAVSHDWARISASHSRMGTVDPMARRGFTLLEVVVAMGVLGVLMALAGLTYAAVRAGADRTAAGPNLATVQLESRRYLADSGLTAYPADVVAALQPRLASGPVSVSTEASSQITEVSVARVSDTVLVLAAGSAGGCLVLVDRLAGPPTWVVDRALSTCTASTLASVVTPLAGGTLREPAEADLS